MQILLNVPNRAAMAAIQDSLSDGEGISDTEREAITNARKSCGCGNSYSSTDFKELIDVLEDGMIDANPLSKGYEPFVQQIADSGLNELARAGVKIRGAAVPNIRSRAELRKERALRAFLTDPAIRNALQEKQAGGWTPERPDTVIVERWWVDEGEVPFYLASLPITLPAEKPWEQRRELISAIVRSDPLEGERVWPIESSDLRAFVSSITAN